MEDSSTSAADRLSQVPPPSQRMVIQDSAASLPGARAVRDEALGVAVAEDAEGDGGARGAAEHDVERVRGDVVAVGVLARLVRVVAPAAALAVGAEQGDAGAEDQHGGGGGAGAAGEGAAHRFS